MKPSTFISVLLAAFCIAPSIHAQKYPAKTIRLIVPYAPGGIVEQMPKDLANLGRKIGGLLSRKPSKGPAT